MDDTTKTAAESLYYCAGAFCPGLGWAASTTPHPYTCAVQEPRNDLATMHESILTERDRLPPVSDPRPTLDLDAIRARLANATPGPWFAVYTDDDSHMNACYVGTVDRGDAHDGAYDAVRERADEIVAITLMQSPGLAVHRSERWDENSALIAHAPTDLAALLARVDEQAGELDEARAERDEARRDKEAIERADNAMFNAIGPYHQTVVADLAEARAEIAAFQGRPEGGLPGWVWDPEGRQWMRAADGTWLYTWSRDDSGQMYAIRHRVPGQPRHDSDGGDLPATVTTPRAAMRACEAAARARGWLGDETKGGTT